MLYLHCQKKLRHTKNNQPKGETKMKNEKMLSGIMQYVAGMNEDDRNAINKIVKAEEKIKLEYGIFPLANLIIDLKADIRAESAKTSGKANCYKSAMNIIKSAEREPLQGAWMVDGKQYVCDGYRALRINNAIDLPALPSIHQPPNMQSIFSESQKHSQRLDLPDIGELKAHIKIQKANKTDRKQKIYWDCGANKPLLDAEFLLSILEAFPDCKAFYGSMVSPVYFTSNDGDAILCPVRRKDNAA